MRKFILPLTIIFSSTISHADTLKQLTIYGNSEQIINSPIIYDYRNSQNIPGYAYATYSKDVDFKKGLNTITIPSLPPMVDQNSITLLKSGESRNLIEQYVNSNQSPDSTEPSVTQVTVEQIVGDKIIERKGRLVSKPNISLARTTLLQDDGKMVTINNPAAIVYDKASNIDFSGLNIDNAQKADLVWTIESKDDGADKLEYSYKTAGISWSTEYRLDIAVKAKDSISEAAKLEGWANIFNFSGLDYKGTNLKLIAGQVNSTPEQARYAAAPVMMAKASLASSDVMSQTASNFEGSNFSDLQSYTIDRAIDLPKQTTKKIKLFENKPNVKLEREYIVDANSGGNQVNVNFKLVNKVENGLGSALPAGKVKVFEADDQGISQFIGEATIDNSTLNDDINITTGKAFDVKSTRTVIEQQTPDANQPLPNPDPTVAMKKRVGFIIVKYELSNQKKTDVKIKIQEGIYQSNWKVIDTNYPAKQLDINRAEFEVPVKAGSKETLNFKVEYSW